MPEAGFRSRSDAGPSRPEWFWGQRFRNEVGCDTCTLRVHNLRVARCRAGLSATLSYSSFGLWLPERKREFAQELAPRPAQSLALRGLPPRRQGRISDKVRCRIERALKPEVARLGI